MLTAAVDTSGLSEHLIFAVAGSVAPDGGWEEFSKGKARAGWTRVYSREHAGAAIDGILGAWMIQSVK